MLFLDTSALVKRYVDEEGSEGVLQLMDRDREWCASALCLAETQVTLCHLGFDAEGAQALAGSLRTDWDRFLVVPIDDLCLARAMEIGCDQHVRTLDAVHLAAADRLPRPATLLSFDALQAEAAIALGLTLADPAVR
jgi:predicted nucleic acid-binding protein